MIVAVVAAFCLAACTELVDNAEKIDRLPQIYPDYIGVTIPADIAPMDFNVEETGCVKVDVVAKGSKARYTPRANGLNGTSIKVTSLSLSSFRSVIRESMISTTSTLLTVLTLRRQKWISISVRLVNALSRARERR